MNIEKDHIGTHIRLTLEARGIRPVALAEQLGVSRAAVSGWLKGDGLSLVNLTSIANALDVSLNWLVMGIGSSDLAADSTLHPHEENLLRLLRHFGDEALQQALGMVSAMQKGAQSPLKHFQAYELVSRTEMPIAVLDADGFLLYSNIYHNRMLGLEEQEHHLLHSHHFTEWIPKIFHRKFRTLLQDTLRKGHATYTGMQIKYPKMQTEYKSIIHANAVSTPSGLGAHFLMKIIEHGSVPT